MTDIKENTSGQGESVDRQLMHNNIDSMVVSYGNGFSTGSILGSYESQKYLHNLADIIFDSVVSYMKNKSEK